MTLDQLKDYYREIVEGKLGDVLTTGSDYYLYNSRNHPSDVGSLNLSRNREGLPRKLLLDQKCRSAHTGRDNVGFILENGNALLAGNNSEGQLGPYYPEQENISYDYDGEQEREINVIYNDNDDIKFRQMAIANYSIKLLNNMNKLTIFPSINNNLNIWLKELESEYTIKDIWVYEPMTIVLTDDNIINFYREIYTNDPFTRNWMSDTGVLGIEMDNVKKVVYSPEDTLYILFKDGELVYVNDDGVFTNLMDDVNDISIGYCLLILTNGQRVYRKMLPTEDAFESNQEPQITTRTSRQLKEEISNRVVEIPGLNNVKKISCSSTHGILLTTDGDVYVMLGSDHDPTSGILGLGYGNVETINSLGEDTKLFIPRDQVEMRSGNTNKVVYPPVRVMKSSKIYDVVAGTDMSIYLTT